MKKISETERIGEIRKNNYGSLMEVVKYNNSQDMWVKFEKGNLLHTNWYDFNRGTIKNPYDKTVYEVGFIGEGKYKSYENGKQTRCYLTWSDMLQRCYSDKYTLTKPTYKECTVCNEWHNFQNFAVWYDDNYYEVEGERTELDKDILVKGNKVYSPNSCVFVPRKINSLFVKSNAKRGDLPIGVRESKTIGKYISRCLNGYKKEIHIGTFNTPLEAFHAYKKHKEEIIKQITLKYKDKIPQKLYDAMVTYKVEIND